MFEGTFLSISFRWFDVWCHVLMTFGWRKEKVFLFNQLMHIWIKLDMFATGNCQKNHFVWQAGRRTKFFVVEKLLWGKAVNMNNVMWQISLANGNNPNLLIQQIWIFIPFLLENSVLMFFLASVML